MITTNAKRLKAWKAAKTAHAGMQPSATKAGPGRYHKAGTQKASPVRRPVAPIGSAQFLGQATNAAKQQRNAIKAAIGARQMRKQVKAMRRAGREV